MQIRALRDEIKSEQEIRKEIEVMQTGQTGITIVGGDN